MIHDKVYELCRSEKTVSGELAKNPTEAPGDIAKRLYGDQREKILTHDHFKDYSIGEEDLEKAEACGKWGPTKPSKLFLQVRSSSSA